MLVLSFLILWACAWTRAKIAVQPNNFTALALSGMNDVLTLQGNTQAAWWNRIPVEAWATAIAFFSLRISTARRVVASFT
jgi:hypothetical protein